jgi:phosphoribosylformylglycinamidine cyclo-ligase
LPEGLAVRIDGLCWPVPPVFTWLSTAGEVAVSEMLRTFNCGIGMVVIADAARAEALKAVLRDAGERAHVMGYVERRSGEAPPVTVVGAEATWPA